MDLNSLPDEMLLNIFKYTKFACRTGLRRISERIDRIARRSNVYTQPLVQEFQIGRSHISLNVDPSDFEYVHLPTNLKRIIENSTSLPISEFFEKWLSKTRITGEFVLSIETLEFDQEMFKVIERCHRSFRKLECLHFHSGVFSLPMESFMKLLHKYCPHLKTLRLSSGISGSIENILNKKVLGNIRWIGLIIHCQFDRALLDDEFLLDVVANCQHFWIGDFKTDFTVQGVINMIKKCSINKKYYRSHRIRRVKLGDIQFSMVEAVMKSQVPGIGFLETRKKGNTKNFHVAVNKEFTCSSAGVFFEVISWDPYLLTRKMQYHRMQSSSK